MYNLYHNLNPMAMCFPEQFESFWFSQRDQHFSHVAKINAPIARIFELSNHFEESWTKNPEIIWYALRPLRSTSVGDVIVAAPFAPRNGRSRISSARVRLVPGSSHRQAWLVMRDGLKELREVSHA